MDRNRLIKPLVALMIFIFLMNVLAQKFYWYYSVWWFDGPMHFLGGFWLSLFFLWFFSNKVSFLRLRIEEVDRNLVLKTIIFVFLIGVAWEFFQFFTKNSIGKEPFNVLDTVADAFFDMAGGVVGLIYYMKINNKEKISI